MTLFEFAVTYAVCWWLVLFMVLPHQADAPARPEPGHARSAPANPHIRKKLRWATLWAILPAVALYFIVTAAHGEDMYHAGPDAKNDDMYHASSSKSVGCQPGTAYKPAADLNARDGYDANGNKVAPATLGGDSSIVGNQDHVQIPLLIPSKNYIDRTAPNANTTTPPANNSTTLTPPKSSHNVDLSQSFIGEGVLDVGQDGTATLNGKSITGSDGCDPQPKKE